MPHYNRQETETWQTVFWGGIGKGGEENWIKNKKKFYIFPKI